MTKTALITGASNGIGLELAWVHARQGDNPVLVARNKAKLNPPKFVAKGLLLQPSVQALRKAVSRILLK